MWPRPPPLASRKMRRKHGQTLNSAFLSVQIKASVFRSLAASVPAGDSSATAPSNEVGAMQHVLIDACGWVACMDAQLNVERELEALLGPCAWAVLPSVIEELERLQHQRTRSKPLLLNLLEQKSSVVEPPVKGHTDDELLALSIERSWAV